MSIKFKQFSLILHPDFTGNSIPFGNVLTTHLQEFQFSTQKLIYINSDEKYSSLEETYQHEMIPTLN